MTEKIKAPFGLWESPLTARMLSQQKKISDVQWGSRENTLYWLENRSGTGVLVSRKPAEGSQELSSDANVEAGIGYGGGEFHVWNDLIVFAGKDGRLYRRSTSCDLPRPIIPATGMSAAPQISPNGKWIVYVFSDGKTDLLGMVDSAGKEWPFKLAQGADFYMQPVWHPNGEMLAWVEWDHPNMPWDGSRLIVADLGGSPPRILTTQHIAGDEKNYVCQPCFSPDGRWLAYIESSEEWDDLILYNLKTGFKHTLVKGSGYYQSTPAWVQGLRFMEWSHDSTSVFSIRNVGGFATLWKINIETGSEEQIQTPSYTWLSQISVSKVDQRLALITRSGTVGMATNGPSNAAAPRKIFLPNIFRSRPSFPGLPKMVRRYLEFTILPPIQNLPVKANPLRSCIFMADQPALPVRDICRKQPISLHEVMPG